MNQSRRDFLGTAGAILAFPSAVYLGKLLPYTIIKYLDNRYERNKDFKGLSKNNGIEAPWAFKMPDDIERRKLLMSYLTDAEITAADVKNADFLIVHKAEPFSFWPTTMPKPDPTFYSRSQIEKILSDQGKSDIPKKMAHLDSSLTVLNEYHVERINTQVEIFKGTVPQAYKNYIRKTFQEAPIGSPSGDSAPEIVRNPTRIP